MEQNKCKPKAFTVFLDTYEHLQLLDMKQRGELFTALYEYAIYDKQIESDSGKVRMAFSFLRAQLDRDFKNVNLFDGFVCITVKGGGRQNIF